MINGEFLKYHPVTNLIYFILCFVSVFYINNPFVLFILLFISIMHNIILDKGKTLRSNAFFYAIIGVLIFLVNPFVSHRGAIVLFYLFNNPMTLESMVYGLKSALSLVTVLITFNAFNIIINPEKFMFLFSRIAEQTSFVIMLGLRFIPTMKRKISEISDISKVSRLNNPVKKQSFFINLKRKTSDSMNTILTLITWSLEDAVITAQSMRSRGYGVDVKSNSDRTFYFIYKFTVRDVLFIFFNITSFVLFLFTFKKYDADFTIYPTFSPLKFDCGFFINLALLIFQIMLPFFTRIYFSFSINKNKKVNNQN